MTLTQITEKGIKDGEIVNADINTNAAIAGTKINPNFGSQGITTTGVASIGNGLTLTGTNPFIDIVDSNNDSDFTIKNDNGRFEIEDKTNSSEVRLAINSSGNVGIGTTSPDQLIHINKGSGTTLFKASVAGNSTIGLEIQKTGSTTQSWRIVDGQTINGKLEFYDVTDSATRMCIDGDGKVGIGTTSPTAPLTVHNSNDTTTNAFEVYNDNGQRVSGFSQSSAGDGTLDLRTNAPSQTVLLRANGISHISGGNLGVGTSSPSSLFQVEQYVTNNSETSKRIAGFYNTGTTTSSNNESYIHMGPMPGHYGVKLGYMNGANSPGYLNSGFYVSTVHDNQGITNHTKKFVILSNGMVGIGKTNPFYLLHLQDASSCKLGFSNTDSGLDENQLIGGIEFTKSDGSGAGAGLCGSINVKSDDSYGARTYMQFKVRSNSTGAAATDTEICRMTPRGLQFFGDTASSSALDDYEEGSWTPSNPTSGLYNDTSLSGHYQKIGSFVHFQFQCRFNSNSSSVNAVIDDFPFTSAESGANYDYGGSIMYKTNSSLGGVLITNQGSRFYLYNTGGSNMTCAQMSNHYIRVHGFVEVT